MENLKLDDGLLIDDVGRSLGSSDSLRLNILFRCWQNRGLLNVIVSEIRIGVTMSHEAETIHGMKGSTHDSHAVMACVVLETRSRKLSSPATVRNKCAVTTCSSVKFGRFLTGLG